MLTISSSLHDKRLRIVDDTIYDWATFSKLDQMKEFEGIKAKDWSDGEVNRSQRSRAMVTS